MKIGRISYANTEPFFHFWPRESEFQLVNGVPKELAEAAKRGEISAGPLPLVECWQLENDFEPLGPWGIAAGEKSRSVFVLSRRPFAELNNVTIGVTRDSATSVVLTQTLLQHKYGNKVTIRKGLEAGDEAWLVIGDQALQLAAKGVSSVWPVITDLATEWWNWKQLPFVFARWVVRRDLDKFERLRLSQCLEASLMKGLSHIPQLAQSVSEKVFLPQEMLERYLEGLIYEFNADTEKSEQAFRELVQAPTVAGAAS